MGNDSPPITPITACALKAASRIWASFSPAPAPPNLFSPPQPPAAPSPAPAALPSAAAACADEAAASETHNSLPDGMQNLIKEEDITERDILIKDKCLVVAKKGTVENALESNTSRNESYYSKLIDTVSRSMIDQPRSDKEWENSTLSKASLAIVRSVQRTKRGRFIWAKQLCGSEYVVLSEALAAHKVTNDIRCQLAAFDAQKVQEKQDETQLQLLQNRLTYGKNLIKTVFTAEKSGLTSMEAARTLDFPAIPDDWPVNEVYTEPEEHRRIRLQLRQRYLALARTNGSLHDFSMKMIAGWTESEAFLKKKMQRKSKSKEVIAKAVNACAEMMNQENISGRAPPNFNRSDLPPSFSSGFLGPLGSVENDESSKHAKTAVKKKTKITKKKNSGEKNDKIEKRLWSLDERAIFLEGLETHAFGNWVLISPSLPGRTHQQVASYGRYIQKKFNLPRDGFPDDACRDYLLRPEGT